MRSRVRAVVFVFVTVLGAGCRKSLAPVTGNQAPETWIVAAPQDTITTYDPITGEPVPPTIFPIPVRFHLYWAGSDHDGAVNGFFCAIVETTATVPEGAGTVPPLPGPKARDYRFTTRTDSIFVSSTSEELNMRQHAFFIYAVDDKGKADATPGIRRHAVTGAVTQDPVWRMLATDPDPLDSTRLEAIGGTPDHGEVLQRKLAIQGPSPMTGRDTCYFVPNAFPSAEGIAFSIPPDLIAAGNITLRVRLCDCVGCDIFDWDGDCGAIEYPLRERFQNDGRCVTTDVPLRMVDHTGP